MQKPAFSIYDASAGSGKTYTLVKEYLKIILLSKKPDAYRNILAITFTNKAVHEMKSRVVESLSEFAKENPSNKALQLMQDIHKETGLSLPTITEKAKSIIKNLIHNYAAFDISTIDKFTHKVIRAFAHDLNLPITFEVSLDTENLLTEAVDAIIAEAGNDETLTNLLVDFTMEKTDDDKSWDISREIMDTGKLILNENNRQEITHFQNKTIAEFIEIKNKLTELCAAMEAKTVELATEALLLIDNKGIDNKAFSLYESPAKYTFIAFWDPTCGHCKVEMPRVDSFYKAIWSELNVKILSVNINFKELAGWKTFIKENKLAGWIHAYQTEADLNKEIQQGKPTTIRQLYDVFKTPTFYLLDANKKIIAKNLSIEQFNDFLVNTSNKKAP